MTHEDVIFDGYPFADERMTRHLDVLADMRVLLNLDERSDAAVVANATTVQINEAVDADIFAEMNIRSDSTKFPHGYLLRIQGPAL